MSEEGTSSVWKIVDGELTIHLHAGQKRAYLSESDIVAVIAGAQSGKTTFIPIWLMREMINRGPGEYGIIAPTFPLMNKKCLPEFLRLFQETLKFGKYIKTDKKFYFNDYGLMKLFGSTKNSCAVCFLHASDPDSLESATFKAVCLDEAGQKAFSLDSFYAIRRRLAINNGRMLITTTPYDLGWLKTKIHDPWKKGHPDKPGEPHPYISVINFRSIDNPYFPLEVYERERAQMPPWKFDLFYNGIFTVPTGTIYDVYKTDVHSVTPFVIPADWPRIWGPDFGQSNFACVKIAVNPNWVKGSTHPHQRRFYVYQTYKPEQAKEVDGHILSLRTNDRGHSHAISVGGASGEDAWRRKFGEAGLPIWLPTIHGPDSVEVGIDFVYKAFASGELAIFNNLGELEKELKTYARELDGNDEITDKILNKNTFHRLDGLRYAVSEFYSNPGILGTMKIIPTWRSA